MRLHPALAQAWRSADSIQLGLSEQHAVILSDLTEADLRVLAALAEGVGSRSRIASTEVFRRIVALLDEVGAVVRQTRDDVSVSPTQRRRLSPDESAWSLSGPARCAWPMVGARAARHVEIRGQGRLAATMALTLLAAGIGTVTCDSAGVVGEQHICPAGAGPDDVGRSLGEVVARGRRRLGIRSLAQESIRPPDLVVLIEPDAADAFAAGELMRAGVDHLSVVILDAQFRIGPLVVPGASACLRCLDLHRSDADPVWPVVLAQALQRRHGQSGSLPGPVVVAEEQICAQITAGIAALDIVLHLDGVHPPTLIGATRAIALPGGADSPRAWPVHPACGCTDLPNDPAARA